MPAAAKTKVTNKETNQPTANTEGRGRRNEVVGTVISDKMDKTITVQVDWRVKHKRYGKFIRRRSVFKAHDETNQAKTGDRVSIFETRPLSKTKRWKLFKVLQSGAQE